MSFVSFYLQHTFMRLLLSNTLRPSSYSPTHFYPSTAEYTFDHFLLSNTLLPIPYSPTPSTLLPIPYSPTHFHPSPIAQNTSIVEHTLTLLLLFYTIAPSSYYATHLHHLLLSNTVSSLLSCTLCPCSRLYPCSRIWNLGCFYAKRKMKKTEEVQSTDDRNCL